MINSGGVTKWNGTYSNGETRYYNGDYSGGDTWEKANDPCPHGWRMPTIAELKSLGDIHSEWTTINGMNGRIYDSDDNILFLPASGYRDIFNGRLSVQGYSGCYWSSTAQTLSMTINGYYMIFNDSIGNGTSTNNLTFGSSVRCVAE